MAESSVKTLWQEIRDLSLGAPPQIDHLPATPSPVDFLRRYVSPNKPCLIPGAASHWPACSLWPSPNYLRSTLASTPVSVHLTPTGSADALTPHPTSPSSLCFAAPHVETLIFPEALDLVLASQKGKFVAYLQQQNDCFRREYGQLAADCEAHIPWATAALGCSPEAVNLWVGTNSSQTSFHKDHYENLYVVVAGEKRFLLLPPTDAHRMYIRRYPAARYAYHQEGGKFSLDVEEPERYVPWCSVDPYDPQSEMELYFDGPDPYEVTVKAGDILYLPSMWFHHVRQGGHEDGAQLTIAINYWYDMEFDIKYAYFNFLQSISLREIGSDLDKDSDEQQH